MPRAASVPWTREHSLIALNLYCKVPFGRLHKTNPVIVQTAEKMGRTANSLAMKLVNFASLDPVLCARGVRGLPNVSQQDRNIWREFHLNLPLFAEESEQLMHDLFTRDDAKEVDFLQQDRVRVEKPRTAPLGPTERMISAKARRGQQFFRQSVLIAYGTTCCISGINVPRLLVASHIVPWSDRPESRLDPRNGLCLSALHDAAFDAGLISLNANLELVISKRLKAYLPQPSLEQNFLPFEAVAIRLPEKLAEPAPEFLSYHREHIFLS